MAKERKYLHPFYSCGCFLCDITWLIIVKLEQLWHNIDLYDTKIVCCQYVASQSFISCNHSCFTLPINSRLSSWLITNSAVNVFVFVSQWYSLAWSFALYIYTFKLWKPSSTLKAPTPLKNGLRLHTPSPFQHHRSPPTTYLPKTVLYFKEYCKNTWKPRV